MEGIGILNVGAGDTKITFDPKNPQDCIRAARIVKDMLKRGYALLVEVEGGKYQRVQAFDENTSEYIIADRDPEAATAADTKEREDGKAGKSEKAAAGNAPSDRKGPGNGRRGRGGRRLSATGRKGVAVARTAGG